MNKLILSLFVVVCVAAINARGDEVDGALYDTDYSQSTGLVFPRDCKRRNLVKYARKCDLTVTRRGKWYIVKDPDTDKRIAVIPRNVRKNRRCRRIINRLTARCEGGSTTTEPSTTQPSAYYGEPEYYKQIETPEDDATAQLYETYEYKDY
ncbi:uncharacterized protein LOC127869483 [Dreissena polymorpha]|uniref:Secreted protein n=1 Tax=Dreissena polymorpha TaxID=45954 RepID=A0A9D4RNV3_DREPO|nr:uncharacterized protein LOC127869483 [Dreissena polymorpha]KAH3875821.1 hypothetical protein DPMN_039099 [Dreissena polymorpha]